MFLIASLGFFHMDDFIGIHNLSPVSFILQQIQPYPKLQDTSMLDEVSSRINNLSQLLR
jgi:hypothetical protein